MDQTLIEAAARYSRATRYRMSGDPCWASRVYDPVFTGVQSGAYYDGDKTILADAKAAELETQARPSIPPPEPEDCPKCGQTSYHYAQHGFHQCRNAGCNHSWFDKWKREQAVANETNAIAWEYIWDDNTYWEAASPYQHDGVHFRWRLRQRLLSDKVQWYADHDFVGETGDFWLTLEEAKAEVQRAHDAILGELMSEVEHAD